MEEWETAWREVSKKISIFGKIGVTGLRSTDEDLHLPNEPSSSNSEALLKRLREKFKLVNVAEEAVEKLDVFNSNNFRNMGWL